MCFNRVSYCFICLCDMLFYGFIIFNLFFYFVFYFLCLMSDWTIFPPTLLSFYMFCEYLEINVIFVGLWQNKIKSTLSINLSIIQSTSLLNAYFCTCIINVILSCEYLFLQGLTVYFFTLSFSDDSVTHCPS